VLQACRSGIRSDPTPSPARRPRKDDRAGQATAVAATTRLLALRQPTGCFRSPDGPALNHCFPSHCAVKPRRRAEQSRRTGTSLSPGRAHHLLPYR
jgi:hypothetical protein